MRQYSRACLAATMIAAVVASTSLAQEQERERRRGQREGAGQREGDREGGQRRGFGGPEGRRGGLGPEGMMRLPIIAAIDADQDGTISKEEIDNAAAALRKLDKNGDGKLTFDEMRPNFALGFGRPGEGRPGGGRPGEGRPGEGRPGQGRPGGRPGPEFFARMFKDRDGNEDGKLSGNEIPEQMKARLSQIDTDGDGAISKAELEEMASRFQRGGGRGGRGRGEGGDSPGGERPRRPEAE